MSKSDRSRARLFTKKLAPHVQCDTQAVMIRRYVRRTNVSKFFAGLSALVIAASLTAACANTVKGAQKDTEKAVEKTAAGANTVDVKSALIADGRVDASNINVDTSSSTKTVVLKGSVPNAQQKTTAEAIARDKAEGYTISNQLTIAPTKQ
jgi:osmotically-inducible protein OsmY